MIPFYLPSRSLVRFAKLPCCDITKNSFCPDIKMFVRIDRKFMDSFINNVCERSKDPSGNIILYYNVDFLIVY